MRKLFRTKMLPFLLILSLVTNGIAPELVRSSTVYAAEAPSGTTAAAESAAVQTESADVVLKNGGIEIDGQFYTDEEFKTLLENSKIVRIPFDSETGRSMIEQAMVSGRVIDTATLAALGIAIAGVFIALAVYLALSSLADNAYQVITGNGKVYDFRFLGDALFINNTYINAFTSTIAVITSFFDDHLTANPDEEVTVPDAGTGDVDKPGEGTEGDIAAIVIGLGDIAGKYGYDDIDEEGYGKCQEAKDEMVTYLKKNKKNGAVITLMWSPRDSGYIWSDYAKKAAGDNGLHVGVLFNGRVYCNVHPYGLPKQQWIDDFNCLPPAIKLTPLEVPF